MIQSATEISTNFKFLKDVFIQALLSLNPRYIKSRSRIWEKSACMKTSFKNQNYFYLYHSIERGKK